MASKSIILFIISVLFIGCNSKSLNIPLSPVKGETEIYDNSSVWFFKDGDSIYINKGGLISSTNWFFAIEKELPLKLVIPNVKKLKKKKKNSIHAKAGTSNYFIYSDTLAKQNSFLNFDSISYEFISNPIKTDSTQNILIKDKNKLRLNGKESDIDRVLNELSSDNFSLYFTEDTDFQAYLSLVLALKNAQIKTKDKHYILK